MMNQEKNDSIQCSIHNCVHHAENVDYCTLDRIHVGTHELNPTKKECTDCDSFQCKMYSGLTFDEKRDPFLP